MNKKKERIEIMMNRLDTPSFIRASLIKVFTKRISTLEASNESCVSYAMMSDWVSKIENEFDYFIRLTSVTGRSM